MNVGTGDGIDIRVELVYFDGRDASWKAWIGQTGVAGHGESAYAALRALLVAIEDGAAERALENIIDGIPR